MEDHVINYSVNFAVEFFMIDTFLLLSITDLKSHNYNRVSLSFFLSRRKSCGN